MSSINTALSNSVWTSTSTSNIANPFVVNSSGNNNAITVDSNGNTVIEKLILKDEKTGRKWQLKVNDGELVIEPLELVDKRDLKLKNVLDGDV